MEISMYLLIQILEVIFEDSNSGAAFGTVANLVTTQRGVVTSENALHDELFGANSRDNSNLI